MVSNLKKIVEKYINEQFDMDNASIDFSCSKLEIIMRKDEIASGSFQIISQGDRDNKGRLFATNYRMTFEKSTFIGNECTIHYRFDSKGLEVGEILKGEINVVSQKGESYLPFVVTIEYTAIATSLGNIKNLFHFANLAKSNWKEAVQLFYSSNFSKIFTGNEKQYFSIYKGLAKDFGNEQNVEEFLIGVNKKQEIEYLLETDMVKISNPEDVVEEKIGITKNGWGYVALHIFVEGDFLTTEKEYLTDDEFLGNHCNLNVYVYSHRLHKGTNYGAIRFTHAYGEFSVPIIVTQSIPEKNAVHIQKELNSSLMNHYMEFRMKKVNTSIWITKTEQVVSQLIKCDDKNPAYRLLQAQLLITQERYNEAKWVLDHVKEMLVSDTYKPEVICYFLYLKTLYKRDEEYVNRHTEEIEAIYKQQQGNWRIAWLLLFLREEYSRSPAKKWILLEEQFHYSNCSPVLYIEAVYLMNANPSLLQELGEFEIQILNFAVKKQLLDVEVIPQIHYLIGRVKKYSERLFAILVYCYELNEEIETIQEICEFLIKGNKTDSKYFKWYALGVEKQLRITKLYEYYLLSIPNDYMGELPKIVMMYFAYACNLGYEKTAFLYANILRHKDTMPEMVRSYSEQMDSFVVDQMQKAHINKELAYLYMELVTPYGISTTVARLLAPLLFLHQVEVEDDNIRQVVVIHDKLKGETRYPIVNGKAQVSIYSAAYEILLQDGFGNRYAESDSYKLVKFLSPRKLVRAMQNLDMDYLGMDIYICESSSDYVAITEENAIHYARLAGSEQVRDEYKREIRMKLLQYYFDNDKIRELDEYLMSIEPETMIEPERAEFIQYMVKRGMYDKAILWIKDYGVEGIPGKSVFYMCSRLLERSEFAYDEFLLQLSYIAFGYHKYDENILQYLVQYYQGTTKNLRDIWKAAVDFDVDTYILCERIIIQMLYSGTFIPEAIDIFSQYVHMGADGDVKLAYLTHCAYEYFAEDKILDAEVFHFFTEMLQDGIMIGRICQFAYLKYFAENRDMLSVDAAILVKDMLIKILHEQIYFPFFMEYIDLVPQLEGMQDRTVLEYKTNTNCKVCLHYVFSREGEAENAEYRKEEMRGIYGRVFLKSFVLFFGENVQYYITEDQGGHEQLTESGTMHKSELVRDSKESKFGILNDMAIAKTLQDYDTLEQLMSEYYKKEYMVDHIFQLS